VTGYDLEVVWAIENKDGISNLIKYSLSFQISLSKLELFLFLVKFTYPTVASVIPKFTTSDGVEYKLLQFHLHWGTNDNSGSEHTINSKRYPSEV
jgi:hypothetical protein